MMRTRKTRVAGKALALGLLLILLAVFSGAASRSAGAADGLSLERADYPFGVAGVADLGESLALADLDGDGDPDAITANPGSDTLSVLPNQGGTLGASTQETACDQARALVVGNLDPNNPGSTPDALVMCSDIGGATLLGDGNGGFGDAVSAGSCCGTGANSVLALGTLNGPAGGEPDVIFKGDAANNERVLCHAQNNGVGGFQSSTCVSDQNTGYYAPLPFNYSELALADIDGDGMNNVIALNKFQDKALFFDDWDLANYPFTGISPVPAERPTGSSGGTSLSPGDIDDDGDMDLVVGNSAGDFSVFIWGENGFDPAVPPEVYTSAESLQDTALGDINDDANMDVLAVGEPPPTGNPQSSILAVHPGNGDGTFDPAVNFELPTGSDRLRVKADDLDGDGIDDAVVMSALAEKLSVFLGASSQNEAPVATGDEYSMDVNGVLDVSAPGVLDNDTDGDGDALTVVDADTSDTIIDPVSSPSNGGVALRENGSFRYIPDTDFEGADSFTYKATDGKGDSNVATVTITVEAASNDPQCSDGADNDGDAKTDFPSDPGCSSANDDSESPDPPQNRPPVANNNAYSVKEDKTLNVPARGVLRNDADADGDTLTATRVSGPGKGKLTLRPDGSFTYKPKKNFNGMVSFVYEARDGNGGADPATVTIRIRPVPG